MDEYLTTKDIQQILRLSHNSVNKLVRLPDFPKIKIGRSYRIPKTDFYNYLKTYSQNHINI